MSSEVKPQIQQALRQLPAVDEVVRTLDFDGAPRWAVVEAVRQEIAELRRRVLEGELRATAPAVEADAVRRRVRQLLEPSLRPVINATGVVLHTNLGRAPLGPAVLGRIAEVAGGYSTLEYQLDQRRRGSRHTHAAQILCQLCGAEDAVVVNNNAAAVFLALAALAHGREVVVSRGELIEIGGSFRLPDVMAASGACLREVGTTNRTHLADYVGAMGEQTALLLKAHRSNFAVVGFTAEVEPQELVALGRERGVPTMFDLGSGCLIDPGELGLPGEVTVQQAVGWGFDLVTFSGDKLLGGPQAGIIVGKGEMVARLRAHPLMRPLRPDKMTLSGLLATLECYRDDTARETLPALRMLATPAAELRRRAARLRGQLRRGLASPWTFEVVQVASRVGGGALPLASPTSFAVAVTHPELSADRIEAALRQGDPPVIARIEEDRLLLDLRTVEPDRVAALARAVVAALAA
jgi:L-seryl-tRNA(Ser) seleniumtransferase